MATKQSDAHFLVVDLAEAAKIIQGLAARSGGDLDARNLSTEGVWSLRQAEAPKLDARYRTLVEQIPAVIFMADLDKAIGEAYVSPHIEAVLGFSRQEWLDDPVRWYHQIHPEDKDRWSFEAAQMLVSGEPLKSTYRVLARDGHVVWLQCEAKMVRDESGRPWFIHGLAVDVSDLKESEQRLALANLQMKRQMEEREEAEKRLRESEERFRLLVDGVRDYAIFTLDRNGYVVSWNSGAERITGYTADEIMGEHIAKFYTAEDVAKGLPHEALRIAEMHERYESDDWRMRKGGAKFWANVVITSLRDDSGRLHGFSKVTRDITERKSLEEKLHESERLAAMGTTAAVFAHEIGNPLNALSTTLQLLKRQMSKPDENNNAFVNSALDGLLHELDHLGSLLNDFRSLARPQRLELRLVQLPQIVGEAFAAQAADCAERGIVLNHSFPVDFPAIAADGRRLKQALFNLCKNAIEAMTDGGKLTVRGYQNGATVCVDVEDSGSGIPEDFDLFELFKTTKPHGTGLGLAIVRQIVAAHRGTISYRTERGKGTTFTISLPLDPPVPSGA